jgi:hypothetical protein
VEPHLGVNHIVVFQRTDPLKLGQIELHFLLAGKLAQINIVVRREQGESIGLGHTPNVVGRRHGAGSRHVLHDHVGIAGHIFAHVTGDQARRAVIAAAAAQPDDDAYLLAFVKLLLSIKRAARRLKKPQKQSGACQDDSCLHFSSSAAALPQRMNHRYLRVLCNGMGVKKQLAA